MPMGNVGEKVGGIFDNLKSRIGFNNEDERYGEYGEYADFDEYGEYGDDYADSEVGGYRSLSTYAPRKSRYEKSNISSSLVSIDDVKASTPLPDFLNRDPLPDRDSQATSPAAPATGVYDAQPIGSAGSVPSYAAPAAAVPASTYAAPANATSPAYDPYVAYSSPQPSAHVPVRTLTVVKPVSYGDVERVARAVKSGDVVVLAMRNTPDGLSKRILDFSFGVASALDANVECPGEKVFAIARGNALTDDEKRRLGAQGVL